MESFTADRVGMMFGYKDRPRHQACAMELDFDEARAGNDQVSGAVSGDKAEEEVAEEEGKDIGVYSGELLGTEAAGSHTTSPEEPKVDLENQGHKASNPMGPWRNFILDLGSSPQPVMLGRQRGREEIIKCHSGIDYPAQDIGKGCTYLECKTAGTGDGEMNLVQQGDQEMSLSHTPIGR